MIRSLLSVVMMMALTGCVGFREDQRRAKQLERDRADAFDPVKREARRKAQEAEEQEKENRRIEAVNAYAERKNLPLRTIEALREGSLILGLSAEEVGLARTEKPDRINTTVGSYGRHEQWVFRRYDGNFYLYFENGKVTSWQSSKEQP